MSSKKLISVVVPVHNEADNIAWFYKEIADVLASLKNYSSEIIYVDDGSRDKTAEEIIKLTKKDSHVKYICLARNFGKEAATSAGMHFAKGDAVIMIDGDGQHPPAVIKRMVAAWEGGAQHVVGMRTSNHKAGIIKQLGSKLYYALTRFLGTRDLVANATDFRLVDRELADVFALYREKKRMTRALLDWSGFTTEYIPFEARSREFGVASYNLKALVRLAVNGYINATLKPLYFIGALGVCTTALAALALLAAIINRFVLHDPLHLGISGSAMIALFVTLLVGLLMITQGIVAIYVANIHLEAQDRPLYIVNKSKSKLA